MWLMFILLFNLLSSTPHTRPVLFLALSSVIQAFEVAWDLFSSLLMPGDWISSCAPDRFLYVFCFFENSIGFITRAEFSLESTAQIVCCFSDCLNGYELLAQDFMSFLFVFLINFKRPSERVCSWHVTGRLNCAGESWVWGVFNSNHHLHIAPRKVGARKKMLKVFRSCKRIMRSPRIWT